MAHFKLKPFSQEGDGDINNEEIRDIVIQELYFLIESLPSPQKEILKLSYIKKETTPEIAKKFRAKYPGSA